MNNSLRRLTRLLIPDDQRGMDASDHPIDIENTIESLDLDKVLGELKARGANPDELVRHVKSFVSIAKFAGPSVALKTEWHPLPHHTQVIPRRRANILQANNMGKSWKGKS